MNIVELTDCLLRGEPSIRGVAGRWRAALFEQSPARALDADSLPVASLRYVTTRQPTAADATIFGDRRDRATEFHYGEIEASSGSDARTATGLSQEGGVHLITLPLTKERYVSDIASLTGDTVVYVHGYNTDFLSAARGALQWAAMAGFSGNVIVFSWPSRGRFLDYGGDRETVVWSGLALKRLFHDLLANTGHRVHVLAHSMGCMALTSAMQLMQSADTRAFDNVMLAAPDLDAELFVDVLWPEIQSLARRWTIYHSSTDLALMMSRRVNSASRLGEQALDIEGIDFVDASEANALLMGMRASHAYHERNLMVVLDIARRIAEGTGCKRRLKGGASKPAYELSVA